MIAKEAVELILKQRPDGTQYIEVWVRSKVKPRVLRGAPVERNFQELALIEALAGAIAEEFGERFGDDHDPSEVARMARYAHEELNSTNPRPVLGDEDPVH